MSSSGSVRGFLDKFKFVIAFSVIGLLLAGSAVSVVYSISSSNVATYNKWTTVDQYDYLVFTDGTTTYAKNGATGAIDYSGTTAATVIQNAVTALSSGQTILVRGDYSIGSTVTIDAPVNFLHYGKATLTGSAPYLTIDFDLATRKPIIYVQEIDGQDKSRDCVKIIDGIASSRISFGTLRNCDQAIYLASDDGNAAAYGDLDIYADIQGNNYGIYFDTPSGTEVAREGIVFHGSMFGNTHGVYFASGNTQAGAFALSEESVIDNASVGGSWDFEDYSTNALPHVLDPKFIRGNKIISETFLKVDVNNTVRYGADNLITYRISADTNTVTTGGGGTQSRNTQVVTLTSGAVANDGIQYYAPTNFLSNRAMMLVEHLAPSSSSNIVTRFGLVATPSSFVSTDTVQGVQMKYNGTQWYIEVSNGTTRQEIATGETATDINVQIIYVPNAGVSVWIAGNSSQGFSTTSAPLPNTTLGWFTNVQTLTGSTKAVTIQQSPQLMMLS